MLFTYFDRQNRHLSGYMKITRWNVLRIYIYIYIITYYNIQIDEFILSDVRQTRRESGEKKIMKKI